MEGFLEEEKSKEKEVKEPTDWDSTMQAVRALKSLTLNVKFKVQSTSLNCGPTALWMAFDYLGSPVAMKDIMAASSIRPGQCVSTIKLALAAQTLGFQTEFTSTSLDWNEEHSSLSFYKRFGDVEDGSELRSVRKRLVEEGGKVMERSVPLPEILSALTPTSIPIILLDMNAITGPSGVEYQGHFVPIIGFCEEGVIIHNQDTFNPEQEKLIPFPLFEKARKARGTDEDLIIVHAPGDESTYIT